MHHVCLDGADRCCGHAVNPHSLTAIGCQLLDPVTELKVEPVQCELLSRVNPLFYRENIGNFCETGLF